MQMPEGMIGAASGSISSLKMAVVFDRNHRLLIYYNLIWKNSIQEEQNIR